MTACWGSCETWRRVGRRWGRLKPATRRHLPRRPSVRRSARLRPLLRSMPPVRKPVQDARWRWRAPGTSPILRCWRSSTSRRGTLRKAWRSIAALPPRSPTISCCMKRSRGSRKEEWESVTLRRRDTRRPRPRPSARPASVGWKAGLPGSGSVGGREGPGPPRAEPESVRLPRDSHLRGGHAGRDQPQPGRAGEGAGGGPHDPSIQRRRRSGGVDSEGGGPVRCAGDQSRRVYPHEHRPARRHRGGRHSDRRSAPLQPVSARGVPAAFLHRRRGGRADLGVRPGELCAGAAGRCLARAGATGHREKVARWTRRRQTRPVISTSEFRNGAKLELDGEPYTIIEFQHVKPGKGGAFVRTKLKSLRRGNVIERTYRSGEKLPTPDLDEREMTFLYVEGDQYTFMDTTTYEQLTFDRTHLGDGWDLLKENMTVTLLLHKGTPIGMELPGCDCRVPRRGSRSRRRTRQRPSRRRKAWSPCAGAAWGPSIGRRLLTPTCTWRKART